MLCYLLFLFTNCWQYNIRCMAQLLVWMWQWTPTWRPWRWPSRTETLLPSIPWGWSTQLKHRYARKICDHILHASFAHFFLFQHPWQQYSILHPAGNPPPGEPPHWWGTKEALRCRSLDVLEPTRSMRRQKNKFIFCSFMQLRTWSSWWSWGHERPWRDEGRQGKGQGWTKEGRASKALGMDHVNAILPVASVCVIFQLSHFAIHYIY